MRILAIDPGPEQSAFVLFKDELAYGSLLQKFGIGDNAKLLHDLGLGYWSPPSTVLVIEQIAAMGMAVGAETFETVFWSGRFVQAWRGPWDRVKRHEVKSHLCHHPRAKDANIRQALIDKFGGKEKAIGRKANPGPLYGIKADCWAALAVAVTWHETRSLEPAEAP